MTGIISFLFPVFSRTIIANGTNVRSETSFVMNIDRKNGSAMSTPQVPLIPWNLFTSEDASCSNAPVSAIPATTAIMIARMHRVRTSM